MLDDTTLRLMRLSGEGYCCSQIMLLLALEDMGRDNPDLIRAAAGLCHGLGTCQGPCGVLTGGACLIALYAGKGLAHEKSHDRLPLMLEEFSHWFDDEIGTRFQGTTCADIAGTNCKVPDPVRCGGVLAQAHERIMDILTANGIDPMAGR